jgi:hypothetical protein
MFARVAHDPESPAFVRQTHGQLLSLSLSMLADSVRTVSTR